MMDTERRQQLNVLAIRVSIGSAMRGLQAQEAGPTLQRAQLLLDQARRITTSVSVRQDIDELQRELDQRFGPQAIETPG